MAINKYSLGRAFRLSFQAGDALRPDIQKRANLDVYPRPGAHMEELAWRARADDVRAIEENDLLLLMSLGGDRFVNEHRENRAKRRDYFVEVAGLLGSHVCDEIEREEGWKDAPESN